MDSQSHIPTRCSILRANDEAGSRRVLPCSIGPPASPHFNRPLSIVRCPTATAGRVFSKHVGLGLPAGVKTVSIRSPKSGKTEDYLTVGSREGLVGLAQLGALEIILGSTNDSLDRLIASCSISTRRCNRLGDTGRDRRDLRKRLKKLGLESFLKSTGGKGFTWLFQLSRNTSGGDQGLSHRMALEMEKEKPSST